MSGWLVVLVLTSCDPAGKCTAEKTVVDRTSREDCIERIRRANKDLESEIWQELMRERNTRVGVECRPAAEA
ncbi:MAG TPA: hypothetical protein VFT98_23070 [Myxococcota bacterium]|nr:hypothetical protein [Myxococcota bacterium]